MGEAERLQELANCALVVADPEPLENDALQVDPTPAHHTVHGLVRPGCDEFGYLGPLLLREARLGTLGPAVQKTLGAMRVEPMDPVAQRLPVHAANPGCLRPVHTVQDPSQRQEPAALACVLRRCRQATELGRRIVRPQVNR
jgi:hypothetical protein